MRTLAYYTDSEIIFIVCCFGGCNICFSIVCCYVVRAVGDKVEHKFDGVFFNDDLLMK